jgi:hypothetical protein
MGLYIEAWRLAAAIGLVIGVSINDLLVIRLLYTRLAVARSLTDSHFAIARRLRINCRREAIFYLPYFWSAAVGITIKDTLLPPFRRDLSENWIL